MNKLISFDIDTKVATMILGDYRKIYAHMKKFFVNNDFIWQQGSTYISNKNMSYQDIVLLIDDLYFKYPYMKKCVRDMVVADVGKRRSLNHLTAYDGTPGRFSLGNTVNTQNGPIPKEDFKEYVLHSPNPKILHDKNRKCIKRPEIIK